MFQDAELSLQPLGARVAPASAYNTMFLLHSLTGHMVECDFLLLVLPLIARLDLFRIF